MLARVECKVSSCRHRWATTVYTHYPTNTDLAFDYLLQTDNAVDDAKRERKRKEIAVRLSREMGEHRDECVFLLSFYLPISLGTRKLADLERVDSVLEGITQTVSPSWRTLELNCLLDQRRHQRTTYDYTHLRSNGRHCSRRLPWTRNGSWR